MRTMHKTHTIKTLQLANTWKRTQIFDFWLDFYMLRTNKIFLLPRMLNVPVAFVSTLYVV